MIRDTFFSMSRFVDLCRKEMVESWKTNILRIVMIYGLFVVAFVWNGYFQYEEPSRFTGVRNGVDPMWTFELIVFLWAIVIMGLLSASFIMERMKSKTSRIAMLMTPATMFEKFFSRWLVFTFGFLIVFLIAFILADWTRVLIYSISYPELKNVIASVPLCHLVGGGNNVDYWTAFETPQLFVLGISVYCYIQSVFVLGSVIWPKNAYIKTFSAVIVVAVTYICIALLLIKILAEDKSYGFHPSISDETLVCLMTIGFFVMAVFDWVLAYFRFKESEIINRW